MQQYAVYSPISLNHTLGGSYHDHLLDREAAEALMLTSQDCLELGIADQVVPEPEGGSHTDPRKAASILEAAVFQQLAALSKLSQSKLLKRRYQKFRRMGERSNYSQEAMNREVDILMNITSATQRRSRAPRGQRRKTSGEESPEVQVSAAE
jgi:enoyl-CoA hydratase/carnithine racemase